MSDTGDSSSGAISIRSLGVMTFLSGFSVAVGLLQTIATAWFFGATRAIEIFFAATTFNMLLLQLASSGQVGEIFTPLFHRIKNDHGSDAAMRAASAMLNSMLAVSVLVAIIAAFFAPLFAALLVPGFEPADIRLCARVFQATAPLIILQITSAMIDNLLRAEHKYGISELLNCLGRLGNLVLLFTFAKMIGLWVLIAGLWFGAIVHFAGQLWFSRKIGYRHRLCFRTDSFRPSQVFRQIPFAFTHILSSQFFAYAVTASLSYLPEGSYASYNYARQLATKINGVVQRPISVIFFNRISQAIAEQASQVRSYAQHALGLSIALNTLCIVPLVVAGDLLLMGLWGSERFSSDRVHDTHWMLIVIVFLIYISSQYFVTRRTNLALRVVARQFAASGLVLLLSGCICLLCVPKLGLGGAILAQYVSTFGLATTALMILLRVDRSLVAVPSLRTVIAWAFSAAMAVTSSLGFRYALGTTTTSSKLEMLFVGSFLAAISMLICFAASWAAGVPESREILASFQRYIARFRRLRFV